MQHCLYSGQGLSGGGLTIGIQQFQAGEEAQAANIQAQPERKKLAQRLEQVVTRNLALFDELQPGELGDLPRAIAQPTGWPR